MKNYLRTLANRDAGVQMVRLALIGGLNTVTYFILFNLCRQVIGLSLFWSVTVAFGLATLISYVLNRRWTFGLDDNSGGLVETAQFFVVNIVAWAVTVLIVTTADRIWGPLGIVGENMAALAAAAVTLIPKFASYRDIVFRKALRASGAPAGGLAEGDADLPHPAQRPANPS